MHSQLTLKVTTLALLPNLFCNITENIGRVILSQDYDEGINFVTVSSRFVSFEIYIHYLMSKTDDQLFYSNQKFCRLLCSLLNI